MAKRREPEPTNEPRKDHNFAGVVCTGCAQRLSFSYYPRHECRPQQWEGREMLRHAHGLREMGVLSERTKNDIDNAESARHEPPKETQGEFYR